ncbi:hypothetical protein FI667_g2578, partial [Globisporangium splendens]
MDSVELTIPISGGKSYKRVYNDVVKIAIDKFILISSTITQLLHGHRRRDGKEDIKFYIDQMELLFQRAHVELIPGDLPFHQKYNTWLLDGYVRMLLETTDIKLITQLLDLDAILYSLEEAGMEQGTHLTVDFELPKGLKPKNIQSIDPSAEIAVPMTDDLSAYLYSFNTNLKLLSVLVDTNNDVLLEIYKHIIEAASKRLMQ